jgi:hypothetical protein
MASESVAQLTPRTAGNATWYLPFDSVNRANDLIEQAKSISVLVAASARHAEDLPPNAIATACWLQQELLEELEKITNSRREEQ